MIAGSKARAPFARRPHGVAAQGTSIACRARRRALPPANAVKRPRLYKITKDAVVSFFEDQALTHAAAIAFYTVLSLAPILVLFLWVTSALGPDMQAQLTQHLSSLIGAQGAEVVRMIVENAERDVDAASIAGWVSLGTLAVSATAVFAQMQVALNAVWALHVKKTKGLGIVAWLRKRLLSLGLVLVLGFLLLVSLILSSAISAVMSQVGQTVGEVGFVWAVVDLIVPFGVYFLLFMALFRFVPDARLAWHHVAFGSAVTALLFVLGKWLIGFYLGRSAVGSAYGAAGSLALMLLWSYYSAAIVMFGAEITQARVRVFGEHVGAEPYAVTSPVPHTARATEAISGSSIDDRCL
jgi:membrane protein